MLKRFSKYVFQSVAGMIGVSVYVLADTFFISVYAGADGLAAETIADCDYTVKIPMSHGVDSLNVAAASAVAFWELGRK